MFVRAFGLVLLVALLVVVVLVVLRVRDAVARYVDRRRGHLSAPVADGYAEAPAVPAGGSRPDAVAAARQDLHLAERDHAHRVEQARSACAEAARDTVLVRVGPVVLGCCTLTVHGAVHELSDSTLFRLDLAGEEPFLTVTDDRWGDAVELGGHHLAGARRLVVAGEGAVRNLSHARAERDQRVATAQAELRRVQEDTVEVDRARMTLEDLEGAPPRPIGQEDDGRDRPDHGDGPEPPGGPRG